ncbi:uncharacterized protein ALTATR162_LOCUS11693 [Alternaria atra]|uniref:Cytochrome P450 monooxygenase n=1 Tax=Alternaria atra TaxID=119953 RepID=A0A8J2N5S5_9PLEO|nr:uncharacterized protein ALTATR162_LOCUS11693 [Alternaria atra]CAG5186751.1 unnamed protein product [Alternaria atra]
MSDLQFYCSAILIVFIGWRLKPFVLTLTSSTRNVPGPILARFTRLWELHLLFKDDFATANIALHKKYGSIVRLAPNRFSIADGEAAKVVLGHAGALDKSNYYNAFGPPFKTNMFTETQISVHGKMRRPVAQLYSNTNLLSFEPFVNTCNKILTNRLKEHARLGHRFDVRELMQFYAFDVIGEITMGSRFGLMEDDCDKTGVISALDEQIFHGSTVGLFPEIHRIMGYAMGFLKLEPAFKTVLDFVILNIQNRASGKTKSPGDRQDFVDKLLQLERDGKATRFDTIDACAANVVAGSDTTAISLTAIFANLSMHPAILARLRRELDDATKAGTISDPVSFKEARELPYLHAVMYESLRVHPAIAAPLVRIVGKNGAQLAGQYFPPGSEVGVNSWVIHHNEDIFGPDASQFKPERWLTEDAKQRSFMERNFLTFGAGPRTCIGKNVSLLEMYKVIPQIVRKFDFVADEGGSAYHGSFFLSRFHTYQSKYLSALAILDVGYIAPGSDLNEANVEAYNNITQTVFGYPILGYWYYHNQPVGHVLMDSNLDSVYSLFYTSNTTNWVEHYNKVGALQTWLAADRRAEYGNEFITNATREIWKSITRAQEGFEAPLRWYKAFLQGINSADEDEIRSTSGMIEQPALFIAAQRDTVGVPALQLNMTLPFSPALQIRTVDAGHFVHIEKAEEVNEALHEFFQSL